MSILYYSKDKRYDYELHLSGSEKGYIMADITPVAYIWKNGEFLPWEEATTHVLTHSLHYGDAVFEGARCYELADGGSGVFRLKCHMERLVRSSSMIMIDIPYSVDELCEATLELIRRNGLKSCYVRPLVYRGYGVMGVNPAGCPIDVVIAVWPWDAYLGQEALERGIHVAISSWRQRALNAFPPAIKSSGNYLNSGLAKIESVQNGYAEALMLNEAGHVCEGTGENIFVIRDGVLMTPPTSDGILEGITRESIIKIAHDLDIPVVERSIARTDLYVADEVFLTGSAAELTPVASVDKRPIPVMGPITKKLQTAYFDVVHGKNDTYKDWIARL